MSTSTGPATTSSHSSAPLQSPEVLRSSSSLRITSCARSMIRVLVPSRRVSLSGDAGEWAGAATGATARVEKETWTPLVAKETWTPLFSGSVLLVLLLQTASHAMAATTADNRNRLMAGSLQRLVNRGTIYSRGSQRCWIKAQILTH